MTDRPGTVIISLDCEGRWGFADRIGPRELTFTTQSLTWAYRSLIDVFERYEIRATFAFVSLFAMPPDEQWERLQELQESAPHRAWTSAPYRDLAEGKTSGWTLHESLEWVKRQDLHEVGSHSYSHLPLRGLPDPGEVLAQELAGVAAWSRREGLTVSTLVYPRNQVEAPDRLGQPMIGFRARPVHGNSLAGAPYFLSPLGLSRPDPTPRDGPVAIPGGEMIHWKCGFRRLVPEAVAVARWRSILRHAARTGGCAHLWLHPHNLVTGHRQLELLQRHLADAAQYIRDGRLVSLNQRDYCEQVLRRRRGA